MKASSALVVLAASLPTHAIILLGSGDPETNTTAPTGTLANSGWELQGNWGFFQGTPIGPHHFITAAHLGGTIGDTFSFRGTNYVTVSTAKDPSSDFQIWEVLGTFPAFAQLYSGPTETGLDLMVFGRGFIRGDEVRINNVLKGWLWGNWDLRLRWGRNKVASVISDEGQPNGDLPHLLTATFDASGTADEAHLAGGDSGGGLFLQQSGVWRLAGINYSADGPYSLTDGGASLKAALFDEGGLYQGNEAGTWQFVPDTTANKPGSFYATRIKARLSWIQGVLASPLTPVLVEATRPEGAYQPSTGAVIDAAAKTIRYTPTASHYYRLQSASAVTITNAHLENGALVLQYR